MNIVSKVTATLTKEDIESIISKHLEDKGYDVQSISFGISKKVLHDYFVGNYEVVSLSGATCTLKLKEKTNE